MMFKKRLQKCLYNQQKMLASSIESLASYTLSYINLCRLFTFYCLQRGMLSLELYDNDAYVIPFAFNNTSNIESKILKHILFCFIEFNKTSS